MIYFLAPDLARPSGGVSTIYRSVDLLNDAGVRAAVVHTRNGFRCRWFENTTPVVHRAAPSGCTSDVLVPPEDLYLRAPGPRARGAQGRVPPERVPHVPVPPDDTGVASADWPTCPDLAACSSSPRTTSGYLERALARPVRSAAIRHWIDPDVFHLDLRRGSGDCGHAEEAAGGVRAARRVLTARGVLDGWQFDRSRTISEAEVAARLQASPSSSSASTRRRGSGCPPAEAIACGCRVVGFHGMAAREFFRPAVRIGDRGRRRARPRLGGRGVPHRVPGTGSGAGATRRRRVGVDPRSLLPREPGRRPRRILRPPGRRHEWRTRWCVARE